MEPEQSVDEILKERFDKLPRVVQDAIVSAHITEHLRALANTHKLHLDQWEKLEHEVQMTLMGFKEADQLSANLQKELELAPDQAHKLAREISETVFEPIRQQLERELEHPEATSEKVSTLEATRGAAIAEAAQNPTEATVAPGTPPPPTPTGSAVRGQSPLYISNAPSHERTSVEGDPYREQVS